MGISIWHLLVVLAVVVIIFGVGKLPRVMGDLGKGIRNFKSGMDGKDGDDTKSLPPSDQDKK
jgi:sec-independent protein translocase protein TatA